MNKLLTMVGKFLEKLQNIKHSGEWIMGVRKQESENKHAHVCVYEPMCVCVPYGLEHNLKYYILFLKTKNLKSPVSDHFYEASLYTSYLKLLSLKLSPCLSSRADFFSLLTHV